MEFPSQELANYSPWKHFLSTQLCSSFSFNQPYKFGNLKGHDKGQDLASTCYLVPGNFEGDSLSFQAPLQMHGRRHDCWTVN